jgi:hypothetical protein
VLKRFCSRWQANHETAVYNKAGTGHKKPANKGPHPATGKGRKPETQRKTHRQRRPSLRQGWRTDKKIDTVTLQFTTRLGQARSSVKPGQAMPSQSKTGQPWCSRDFACFPCVSRWGAFRYVFFASTAHIDAPAYQNAGAQA